MRTLIPLLIVLLLNTSIFASENAVVVINQESSSSKLVGNFYIAERNIPADNVIYLAGIPKKEIIGIEDFRKLILRPIIAKIESRKLANQVDYIIYSTGFPTIIDASADRRKHLTDPKRKRPINSGKTFTPFISINSATYFYQSVLNEDVSYLSLQSNTYSRSDANSLLLQPFTGDDQVKFKRAIGNAGSGEFNSAIAPLEELAKKHPLQLATLYWLARCNAWKGDAEQAISWLKRCIAVGWACRDFTQRDVAFEKIKNNDSYRATVEMIPNIPYRGGPAIGFRSAFVWGPNGMINSTLDQGNRYLLSTVLGVNRNKGNSEREILSYLKRSIAADGSKPNGTFYFTKTNDVRTKTRLKGYAEAAAELRALGYQSEVVPAVLPKFKNDVAGLSIGSAKFNLGQASLNFMPGAIGENLTSFGGRLTPNSGQTKLSEFLRHGAAGSSGTIVEPFALQAKFPHPRIHVHYVRGCSLAESFYQSVSGPFQLLIVGDALCRPWAKIPRIKIGGNILSEEPISGDLVINISGDNTPVPIRLIEMYLDGRLIRRIQASQIGKITVNSEDMPDGYHEFRFVPVASNPLSTRGSISAGVVINNKQQNVRIKTNTLVANINDSIDFDVFSEGARKLLLLHNKRIIKEVDGDSIFTTVPAFYFGRGTVNVEAIALHDEFVRSRPLELKITGPISSSVPQIKDVR